MLKHLAWLHIAPLLASSPTPTPLPSDLKLVIVHLQHKYDEVVRNTDGTTSITGLAYAAAEATFKPVYEPTLAKLLPTTRFLTTTLLSNHHEYPMVELLVSLRSIPMGQDIRSAVSPVYGEPSRKFLMQFMGLSAKTAADREALTRAIGTLFASVTHASSLRSFQDHGSSTSLELGMASSNGGSLN